MLLKASIEKLMRNENLSDALCQGAIDEMLNPTPNPLQIAAFLVLLRCKRETANELVSIVKALRAKMITVPTNHIVLDIVGTGGDGFNTVNISTASAILAACCGIKVAKHGNRSVSSLSGSADVLEALGVNIQLTPEKISKSIDEIGIGFCYAPAFQPVMQALRNFRKQLNVPTTFNYLGPLLNPAGAAHMVLGVADPTLTSTMSDVLMLMKNRRSVVVHGMGLDEISCVGPAQIIEIHQNKKIEYRLDPKEFGFSYCSIDDLRGGDANTNAKLLLDTFKGKKGPIADTLLLNTAVALYIYGASPSITEALSYARENLANGAALTLLNNWIQFTHD